MRIAIVSDIHGNRTAFEAVLADLKETAPDVILHGGDLADSGSSPVEIIDHIRYLGWPGVAGNTDQMLSSPQTLTEFASQSPALQSMFAAIEEMAAYAREALGPARLAWLSALPQSQVIETIALVHASPGDSWRAPAPEASDAELQRAFTPLIARIVVHAHVHRPYIRRLPEMIVANTGSVSLSYDGDRRAAYLLVDDEKLEIRRVEYDLEKELNTLRTCGLAHSDWVERMLIGARPEIP